MAVIKEIKNGSGGIIRIHDDYCKNNTPEDNQKIIDNVSRIVNDYYIRKSVGQRKVKDETRCDHIPFYSPPGSKPPILAVEKPGRDAFDGRTVLAGGVRGCGRNGV